MTNLTNRIRNRLYAGVDRLQVWCGLRSERAAAFRGIYRVGKWGGGAWGFYSGAGSDDDVIGPYATTVNDYIRRHNIRSVVDLGCGDFRASSHLAPGVASYVGVDIVPELIARNQTEFGSPTIEFRCLDVVEDPLPDGQLCLIKHVLQHMSEADIQRLVPRLHKYQHVLAMDGRRSTPVNDESAYQSGETGGWYVNGLRLDQPPFNFHTEELLRFQHDRVMEKFLLLRIHPPAGVTDKAA